jgi:tRNA-Thr(GGU) m(6)t(6)A37 methyltransferase TsaA
MDGARWADEPIQYSPIGVIRSPFAERRGMPIQAAFADGAAGMIELKPQYAAGLKDLQGFSHLILVYHFHQSEGDQLLVRPFLDEAAHGVFATRAPRRPNAIGISTVRLERIEGTTLYVSDLDMLDGTPLLDIKPYVPQFDDRQEVRIGWLEKGLGEAGSRRADDRFL